MNSLDKIGVARESWQPRAVIGLEQHGHIVLLRLAMREVEPGERTFEVAPDPLNRIQLRTIGREPQGEGVIIDVQMVDLLGPLPQRLIGGKAGRLLERRIDGGQHVRPE
jgi:hypothetical protein